MDQKSEQRPEGQHRCAPWVALTLLGMEPASARREAEAGLEPAVAALRDSIGTRFGLSAEQQIALVLDSTRALGAAETARALGIPCEDHARLLQEARARVASRPARRCAILEDDWLARRLLEDNCAARGVEVVTSTADPALAIEAALVYRPGLAFIDLEINGDELAGEIAGLTIGEQCPDTRVVFVTGYHQADRIAALMPNSEALIKPVDDAALERVIESGWN